jgi:hypothetical protein
VFVFQSCIVVLGGGLKTTSLGHSALTQNQYNQKNMKWLKKLLGIKSKCQHCGRALEDGEFLTPITIRDNKRNREKTLQLCWECMKDFASDPNSTISTK